MKKILGCLLVMGLAACSGGDKYSPYGGTDKPTAIKIGRPYDINGRTYYPKYQPDYVEIGTASWYGPGFDGRMTASGERFRTGDMTAAHPTLPMPSFVRVTRMDNGKSVVVRVNDRGPFARDRIIDLSRAAAEKIGLVRDGHTIVKVQYLPDETEQYVSELGLTKPPEWYGGGGVTYAAASAPTVSPMETATATVAVAELDSSPAAVSVGDLSPASAPPSKPSFSLGFVSEAEAATAPPSASFAFSDSPAGGGAKYKVQVGAFSQRVNAERLTETVADIGATSIQDITVNGKTLYRVTLGPLASPESAQTALNQVQGRGYRDARIIVE